MKITGAEAIIKCLQEQGVDTIFGYPGGAILPFYDALYEANIRHILPVHEQGAAHMADGYARASGKVGVCVSTSGPGATNLVTGLATAFMDSIPIVAITGQVATGLIGSDAFQEVDITGITMPITKHNFLVKDKNKLIRTIRMAFKIARSGRPGPVLIDVPRDVQTALIEYDAPITSQEDDGCWTPPENVLNLINDAVKAIQKAKRPVVHVGGGVINADAQDAVVKFVEKCGIPVVCSLMGIGGVSGNHPNFLGMAGMHGHKHANMAVYEADLIIAIASRFNDRVTGDRTRYASRKTVIHIDIDPAEIDKNVIASIGLAGPIKNILERIIDMVVPSDIAEWKQQVCIWQKEAHAELCEPGRILPECIMEYISERLYGVPSIFVTDVGQHQMWAAQYLKVDTKRGWLTSGGLGTMGFGLPAAIGAKFACPDKKVVHFAGDGGFKMTGAELFTAATYDIPVITIVLDNSCLGMVRQLQYAFYPKRYSQCMIPSMNFISFAESFGLKGEVVDSLDDFKAAFERAISAEKSYIITVRINTDDVVSPMVAPGSSLTEYVNLNAD